MGHETEQGFPHSPVQELTATSLLGSIYFIHSFTEKNPTPKQEKNLTAFRNQTYGVSH